MTMKTSEETLEGAGGMDLVGAYDKTDIRPLLPK